MGALVDSLRSITLGPFNPKDRTLSRYFGARPAAAGIPVNVDNASGLSVAWSCVQLISSAVGLCQPHVYRRRPDGSRERWPDHPVERLLTREPNGLQTAVALREAMARHVLLRGWSLTEVERDEGGRPFSLYPLHPDLVSVDFDAAGRLGYRVGAYSGTPARTLQPSDVCVVVGAGSEDGIRPTSVVSAARDVFSTALAADRYAGLFFRNGAQPSGLLSHPKALSPTARKNLEESMKEHHGGEAAHTTLVLEEGMTWTPVTFSAEDAELLDSRRWSGEEIARLFNCPPSLVGVGTGGQGLTYKNSEDELLKFLALCLLPLLKRIEAAYNRSLISSLERGQQYIEHDTTALVRADLMTRYQAYQIGVTNKWLTVDEIREKENMPPLPAAKTGGPTP